MMHLLSFIASTLLITTVTAAPQIIVGVQRHVKYCTDSQSSQCSSYDVCLIHPGTDKPECFLGTRCPDGQENWTPCGTEDLPRTCVPGIKKRFEGIGTFCAPDELVIQ